MLNICFSCTSSREVVDMCEVSKTWLCVSMFPDSLAERHEDTSKPTVLLRPVICTACVVTNMAVNEDSLESRSRFLNKLTRMVSHLRQCGLTNTTVDTDGSRVVYRDWAMTNSNDVIHIEHVERRDFSLISM